MSASTSLVTASSPPPSGLIDISEVRAFHRTHLLRRKEPLNVFVFHLVRSRWVLSTSRAPSARWVGSFNGEISPEDLWSEANYVASESAAA